MSFFSLAGAARREVLELRAYKNKADAALALAEKRIEELQQEVHAVTSQLTGSTLASGKVSDLFSNALSSSALICFTVSPLTRK